MTWDQRVAKVRLHGFTDRQAAFLVTVMLHAGVCVGRQYCAFAGIPHGRKVCDFFDALVTRRYATARPCGHHRARLFHIHHKPLYRAVGGMFVGTYVGGSINFNAVALGYQVQREGVLYAGSIAVDNVITTLWMVATLALPRLLAPLWHRPSGEVRAPRGQIITGVEEDTETLHPLDLAIVLGLGFGAVFASEQVAAGLGRMGMSVPSILILTVVALALAQIRAVSTLSGARLLGMFAVYLFLAVIGAFCDLHTLGQLGRLGIVLLAFAGTVVAIHGAVTFAAARLLRLDLDMAAVASQANIGGSTSALALARSLGRGDLVLPAVLIGALGNGVGTFLGFWAAARLL